MPQADAKPPSESLATGHIRCTCSVGLVRSQAIHALLGGCALTGAGWKGERITVASSAEAHILTCTTATCRPEILSVKPSRQRKSLVFLKIPLQSRQMKGL